MKGQNIQERPGTATPDGSELRFDFPALKIGTAEYEAGPTGCTVLHFQERANCSVDVRGGQPGLLGDYPYVDAICLAGGSLYGLEAASGVAAGLLEDRGGLVAPGKIAAVSGAIIYDFGGRDNAVYPDRALGLAALRAAACGVFPQGRHGAGRSARVGKFPAHTHLEAEAGGQGAAFAMVSGARVFVATVVNSIGVVVDRQGCVVRGLLDRETGIRRHPRDVLAAAAAPIHLPESADTAVTKNTTLTVVVTDQPMSALLLRQLGRQVHSSMARAIQPFHTSSDGDILYAVSTGTGTSAVDSFVLAEAASDLAWDAVLRAVGAQNLSADQVS
jgi:L-aminopeptidase/D-esterase-like protein